MCKYNNMREKIRDINEIYIKEFGRNLCAERNRQNLSQDDLGKLAYIDGRYISRIERGEINPTLTTIIAIIEALNITFDELYKSKKEK